MTGVKNKHLRLERTGPAGGDAGGLQLVAGVGEVDVAALHYRQGGPKGHLLGTGEGRDGRDEGRRYR